ncbi:MAG: phosphoenolpyruvate carboxykinase (GTP) [Candidatus Lokiarchaeota archaeon]|nr:phosphoenolpyruvate carboxykinase (GTP) [Candidatus Lokiarchaeota archaeon]
MDILRDKLTDEDYEKLKLIGNSELFEFIAKYVQLCNPAKIKVSNGSLEDIEYIREAAIQNNEEIIVGKKNHTVHFDGFYDQARDKKKTKFLLPEGVDLGPEINSIDRKYGLKEIHEILKNIMEGHELFISFYTLGPKNSEFSIHCVQLTDSAYVAHSENLLYRQGYDEFVREGENIDFLRFVHSQGKLKQAGLGLYVSKNIDKRRVYIDLKDEIIFSTNTQYGGNTIGLKKLAMRLAINRSSKEGWLTEHMFVMGIHSPNGRKSYFLGAYPSMCGKTSTSLIKGETIIGDDIAYLRILNGEVRGVNVEKGMFGIIQKVNSKDNPRLWSVLNNSNNEIIFSNVLVTEEGEVYWNGKNGGVPESGINYSGNWKIGKKDENGKELTPSHKNARFTISLTSLDNLDPKINDPNGVEVSGIIYGGRDSDTCVPVEESFDWGHGVITKGAFLESETTAATLGKSGVLVFNPMANLDFLSIPIGKYIVNQLEFGGKVESPPKIFSVNYFLKDGNNKFLNDIQDKRVWLKWMELRAHNEVDTINTPTGLIPKYSDLKKLFKEVLNKEYTKEEYEEQFTVRVPQHLAKINRMKEIYTSRVHDTPDILFEILEKQERRLINARKEFGDYISPFKLSYE